jgi:hypothetical protein
MPNKISIAKVLDELTSYDHEQGTASIPIRISEEPSRIWTDGFEAALGAIDPRPHVSVTDINGAPCIVLRAQKSDDLTRLYDQVAEAVKAGNKRVDDWEVHHFDFKSAFRSNLEAMVKRSKETK